MKKGLTLTILLVLCLALCFSFASCGSKENTDTDTNAGSSTGTSTNTSTSTGTNTSTETSTDSDTSTGTESTNTDTNTDVSVHKHTEEIIPAVEPTCTEAGLTEGKKCTACGEVIVEQEVLPATGHNFTDYMEIGSSCGANEPYKVRICRVCEYYETNSEQAIVHPHDFEYVDRAATCTLDGITDGAICKKCGFIATYQLVEAYGHDYDNYKSIDNEFHEATCNRCQRKETLEHSCNEYTIVLEANCYQEGRKVGICRFCDAEVEKIIPITHKFNNVETIKEATCKSIGEKLFTCTICGATETRYTSLLPHSYDDGKTTLEPTCTENGVLLYTCTVCSSTKSESIKRLGHSYDTGTVIKEPTCSETGLKETRCSRCGDSYEKVLPILHQFDSGVITITANCTTEGKVLYTCTLCGEAYEDNIGFLHNTTYTKAKACTCTDDGNKEYYQCQDCEKYFSYVFSSNLFVVSKRDYTRTYAKTYYTETSLDRLILKATGHDFSLEWNYNSEQHYHACLNKGCATKIDSEAHTFEEHYELSREYSSGEYIYYIDRICICVVCGYAERNTNSDSGNGGGDDRISFVHEHSEVEILYGADPTCTKDGLTNGVGCAICDFIYDAQEIIPALGHDFIDGVCSRCGIGSKYGTPGLTYELNSDKTAYICTGIGTATTPFIVIASEYEGLPVTEIAPNAFTNNYDLISIIIPSTITKIGDNAFYDCQKLVEVYNLSNNLTIDNSTSNGYLGHYALDIYTDVSAKSNIIVDKNGFVFYNGETYYLLGYVGYYKDVLLPNAFKGYEYSIYKYAFYGDEITGLRIGTKTKAIGVYAFYSCIYIEKIQFNAIAMDDLTQDSRAFYNSEGQVFIGKNVTKVPQYLFRFSNISSVKFDSKSCCVTIGYGTFEWCEHLKYIEIPESLIEIEGYNFQGCYSLKDVNYFGTNIDGWLSLQLGDSPLRNNANLYLNGELVTDIQLPENTNNYYIGNIRGCASLISIIIPNGYQIPIEALKDCISLKTITIEEGVTEIPQWAFYGCISLETIYIPSSMSNIDASAFIWCDNLKNISINDKNSSYKVIDNNIYTKNGTEIVLYAKGKVEKSFVIPNHVSTIGRYAFQGADYIVNLVIPSNVVFINESAFCNCSSLTNLTINYGVTTIGKDAFLFCYSLTNISIPDSVSTIGSGAFQGCSLKDIKLSSSMSIIPSYAFAYTPISSIVIPSNIKYIEDFAFDNCTDLFIIYNYSNIDITTKSYENGAIGYYATVILKPNDEQSNFKIVDDYVFATHEDGHYLVKYLGSDAELVLPKDYNGNSYKIGAFAFSGNNNITKVTISNGVLEICEGAFHKCANLQTLIIGQNVKSINNVAFGGCDKLFDVYNLSDIELVVGFQDVAVIGDYAKIIYTSLDEKTCYDVIDGFVFAIANDEVYLVDYVGMDSEIFLPTNYYGKSYKIGDAAFSSNTSIKKVYITDGVTAIGKRAFYNSSIEEIKIGDSVLSIGDSAFYHCIQLEKATLGTNIQSIGGSAFYNCNNLKEINIPTKMTKIEYYTFGHCNSLTNIIIPDNITSIEQLAFSNCDSLQNVVLSKNLKRIGPNAFSGPALELQNGIYYLDNWAISSVTDNYIYHIKIRDNTIGIADNAFYSLSNLSYISLPDSILYIGDYLWKSNVSIKFNEYDNAYYLGNHSNPYLVLFSAKDKFITSCTINENTKIIKSDAFYSCDSLEAISIPENVVIIDDSAFYFCKNLRTVFLPDNIKYMGNCAFGQCYFLTTYCQSTFKPSGWVTTWNDNTDFIYWYSENEPTTEGNYWHYGDNGEIVVWE